MERLSSQKLSSYERLNSRDLSRLNSQRWSGQNASGSYLRADCKSLLVGFVFGGFVMYLLLFAVKTPTISLDVFQIRASRFHLYGSNFSAVGNAIASVLDKEKSGDELDKEKGRGETDGIEFEEKAKLLYALWDEQLLRHTNKSDSSWKLITSVSPDKVPRAPHLQNCEAYVEASEKLDSRTENGTRPRWTLWKGFLRLQISESQLQVDDDEDLLLQNGSLLQGPYPPWVEGGDEDNLPMTRRVQRDLWLHQHPPNCNDPHLKFLLTDWETNPGFGLGAQIAGMAGMLALAVNQSRILVTNYLNRADHEGCVGSARSQWSCYFLPETSQECRQRALELAQNEEAWKQGIITSKENYTTKEIWVGKIPRKWGKPWETMQPTTEIEGKLLKYHRTRDRRWWRSQAVRYLMRFQSKYTCELLNIARHQAFGMKAAEMVAQALPAEWPKVSTMQPISEIDQYVWLSHKPWVPRPLLSVHVRLGDKAAEMKMVGFRGYMNLAYHIRAHFPDVKNIWLSTEMQEVIDESKSYKDWNFYYTKVKRQVGNMTMQVYEVSLGRETSTNYPLVNFLMAADADFFVGALGSTWCFLIDGMRATGGKVMAGYLSVNKDRFW
eukprot:TRINITY_DN4394_c0_g1_i1.p1 TRINITY_DN4394_c0_g1~~TRINITY_DN4394_c0_g1_i1.p1  ORF type:complete len:609 (-),score=100.24 TRINITY_DN4394_c0_g1_i1:264-2090(-)